MLLRLDFKLNTDLTLPINYQHILQSAIYALVRNEDAGEKNYHDEGAFFQKRTFRLFVFGALRGNCRVRDGRITFREKMSLEIRSVYPEMIEKISRNVEERGIRFGNVWLDPFRIFMSDVPVKEEELYIELDSPIVAYRTSDDKKTRFYSPWEEEFYSLVQDNFKRKYKAYCEKEIQDEDLPELLLIEADQKDKVVTRYKNFYITGWKGTYLLRGKAEYLDFLYQTGLGSKNSQGFGLFHIVRRDRPWT